MDERKKAARRQPGGGVGSRAGGAVPQGQSSTPGPKRQAPRGELPAYRRGHLIVIAGRHVASVRAGALCRTFDASRELLEGGLAFRTDVLALARDAGASVILCRERQSGRVFRIRFRDFLQGAWQYSHPRYGEQLVVSLDRWDCVPRSGAPRQLGLFP